MPTIPRHSQGPSHHGVYSKHPPVQPPGTIPSPALNRPAGTQSVTAVLHPSPPPNSHAALPMQHNTSRLSRSLPLTPAPCRHSHRRHRPRQPQGKAHAHALDAARGSSVSSDAVQVVARPHHLAHPLVHPVRRALLALHHLQVRHAQPAGAEHGHLRAGQGGGGRMRVGRAGWGWRGRWMEGCRVCGCRF